MTCDYGPECPFCNEPAPAPTAAQTVDAVLALVAVFEAREPAWRAIPTHLIRELIEGNAR